VSAAAVARSWAVYVSGFFQGWLQRQSIMSATITVATDNLLKWMVKAPLPWEHSDCCPFAAIAIILCTSILITGAKESARFNTAMTVLNLTVLGFVVLAGWTTGSVQVRDNLLTPSFFPQGVDGVSRAAGLVFFSYLGFDMVSCLSEEVIDPERNMPIGIVGSLVASTFIYCAVSLTVVGMVPIALLGEDVPVVNALLGNACCSHEEQLQAMDTHSNLNYECVSYALCDGSSLAHRVLLYGSQVVSCGAIFGLTTATFACLMGQPRIFFSMAQDGLLFKVYGQVSENGVPTAGTIMTGIMTALTACFVDLEALANTISLGTLQVFTFVNAGVIILRATPPFVPTIEEMDHSHDEPSVEDQIQVERSKLISSSTTSGNQNTYTYTHIQTHPRTHNNTLIHSDTHTHRSSLLPDDGGAILLQQISQELRSTSSENTKNDDNKLAESGSPVEQNGSKPYWFSLMFTVSAILSSMGISRKWSTLVVIANVGIMILSAVLLLRLPQLDPPNTFSCPAVPAVPLMGILCNSYMMGSMPLSTWSAIAAWLFAGVCFYFSYGIHHSELRKSAMY